MAKASGFSIGKLFLQIALGCMLSVAGIWALQGGGDAGIKAIRNIIDQKNVESILCIVYGVIELIAGVFLILELFIGDRFGVLGNVLMIIIMIIWILAVILIDFIGSGSLINHGNHWNFLNWLYDFAYHLIVLGAIIVLNN